MNSRHLIFLDIDGVLAHFGSNEQLDPACIERLNQLVQKTGAEIVLTSSWRDTFGVEETRRRLVAAGFQGQLVRAVPPLPQRSRSHEIDAFLAANSGPVRFAILDDVAVAVHLEPNLVLVDDFVGLTALDVARASALLGCPPASEQPEENQNP